MKKLIPAIGMTLLGAALLGTSTYAWFSANKTVTATGMNLAAKADSSLLISDKSGADFSNTMLLANDVTTPAAYMDPVKATFSDSEGTYSFKKLSEEGKAYVHDDGSFVYNGEGTKTIDDFLVDTTNSHYHDSMWLKYDAPYEGTTAPTQTVNMAATMKSEGTEAIYKSFRVALVDVENKTVLDTFSFTTLGTKVDSTKTVTLTTGTAKQVDVYAWLEGADTNCFNANAIKGQAYTVDLEFSIPSSK